MGIVRLLFTIYTWIVTGLCFTLHWIAASCGRPFSKDPEWQSIRWTWPFIRVGFFLCRFQFSIQGCDNIPLNGPFILVSNHQSHLDILMYLKGIPKKFAFVAKQELLRVPILGWDMRNQGHIAINRSDPRGAVAELKRLEQLIEGGKSVLLFPEGTRSADGQIGPFKKGAFMMAVHTGVPIIPCFIEGTGRILNKKSLMMHPGTVTITVGKPMHVDKQAGGGAKPQAEALMHQAREWILGQQQRSMRSPSISIGG